MENDGKVDKEAIYIHTDVMPLQQAVKQRSKAVSVYWKFGTKNVTIFFI